MCSNDRHWKKKYMIPFSKSLDLNSKSMQIFHLDLIMLGRQTHTHRSQMHMEIRYKICCSKSWTAFFNHCGSWSEMEKDHPNLGQSQTVTDSSIPVY